MTDSSFNQLRFDICENVRLHTQQPSMESLLELDLCPDVEIKDKGNHLKIEGCLRLKGAYLAEDQVETEGEQREELSYIIPVEITLPADRAEMEHISAEIESFDYQVLSPFELQIDAILLIDGLIPEQHVEEVSIEQSVPMFSGDEAKLEIETNAETEENPEQDMQQMEQQAESVLEQPAQQIEAEQEIEENQEIIAERPTEDNAEQENQSDQVVMEEHEQDTETSDHDWAHWLVGEKEENFTSVRMVIVQNDDSVQRLAERYEVTPGKIRQANQLADDEVEKGQIVYIPK